MVGSNRKWWPALRAFIEAVTGCSLPDRPLQEMSHLVEFDWKPVTSNGRQGWRIGLTVDVLLFGDEGGEAAAEEIKTVNDLLEKIRQEARC